MDSVQHCLLHVLYSHFYAIKSCIPSNYFTIKCLDLIPNVPDGPPHICLPLTYGANQTVTLYSGTNTQILPPPFLAEGAASVNLILNT